MRRERIEKAIVTLEIEDGHAKRSWVQRQDGDVATAAAVFDAVSTFSLPPRPMDSSALERKSTIPLPNIESHTLCSVPEAIRATSAPKRLPIFPNGESFELNSSPASCTICGADLSSDEFRSVFPV